MSHFSILVVGNVDYNMAPFHEFECDGIDDEFIQTIDVTDRYKKDFEEAKATYQKELSENAGEEKTRYSFKGSTFKEYLEDYCSLHFAESQSKLDLEGEHKYGYFYPVPGTEDDFKVFDRTNPNKFYDYYGNGWNAFKLKNPREDGTTHVNHAFKSEIDFAGQWAQQEKDARETYRRVIAALGCVPTLEHTWSSLVDKFYPGNGKEPTMTRDEAIEVYESQKAVKDWDKAREENKLSREDIGLFTKVDDFAMTEDEYVASQTIHSLSFGYVINREYHSRGRMGWWAMVSDEKEPTSWDEEYKKFIESLPDDAELTMLDCHI